MRLINIIKKTTLAFISLSLALCLIFSLFATSATISFSDIEINKTSFSANEIEHGVIHNTPISRYEFLAELIDSEEDDNAYYKKYNALIGIVLRTLWSYSCLEAESVSKNDSAEHPTLFFEQPYYIEYCSLKIPS